MRKKKVKLYGEQILIHQQLEEFVKKIVYVGEQDLREVAQDEGWFAVFLMRGDPKEIYAKHWTDDCYETIILARDRETAEAIVKFNPSNRMLIVNLKHHSLVKEIRKSWMPMELF